jgi:hypothetical protein
VAIFFAFARDEHTRGRTNEGTVMSRRDASIAEFCAQIFYPHLTICSESEVDVFASAVFSSYWRVLGFCL